MKKVGLVNHENSSTFQLKCSVKLIRSGLLNNYTYCLKIKYCIAKLIVTTVSLPVALIMEQFIYVRIVQLI